ncbi:odorant receptor 131-2-like [Lates calcarifer]|uniref:Odorant receptor 131-2-like n=1 Tax=Lates calcarifer TaxID=8187 RepID=A0AAJ7Q149_LATCA|nr:odorant receptor 131-2-like [Lates calcarifer]
MSYATQFHINITVELQYEGLLGLVLFFALSTVPSCVFLFINGTMLFTLRSKPVFRKTSRYILLFNLLLADTAQLVQSQVLYLLAVSRIKLTYPVCGVLTHFTSLTGGISPLTLVLMSLERYVAVCYPLRHATIITIRNTVFSSLNVLTQILLLLDFPFKDLESLQMKDFCSGIAMLIGPLSDEYNKAYNCFVFVSAGVAIITSYIGVMVAARSASTDKASARKARNTLLLHLVQLGLSLSATTSIPLHILSKIMTRVVFLRIHSLFYVYIIILPKKVLSFMCSLIRPALMYHLCCQLRG